MPSFKQCAGGKRELEYWAPILVAVTGLLAAFSAAISSWKQARAFERKAEVSNRHDTFIMLKEELKRIHKRVHELDEENDDLRNKLEECREQLERDDRALPGAPEKRMTRR